MSIEVWWPKIRQASRDWLVANNGDAVPGDVADDIIRVGGEIAGSYLSDDAVDWVEAVANGEEPNPPIVRDHMR
jgi:hypothetical protein